MNPSAFTLPPVLTTCHADLLAALVQPNDPREWEEGETYAQAHAPRAVARILLPRLHAALAGLVFRYLWREEFARLGRVRLGQASVVSGKLRYFTGADFLLEFNWTAWQHLTPLQQVALVDHELMHCGVDAKTGRSILLPHDVEEFGPIVERWGLWKPDLAGFGDAMRAVLQLSLFAERPEAEPPAGARLAVMEPA